MELKQKHCVPCEGDASPLSPSMIAELSPETPDWRISEDSKKIYREFKFADFKKAMEFVNAVAMIANAEDHHPDIHIHYNRVGLELWTHAIGGLSENDFIVASKVDELK
jgi:4a-hydroxytetrahydrobiopterin dehydratase